jgi:hypothetical protein
VRSSQKYLRKRIYSRPPVGTSFVHPLARALRHGPACIAKVNSRPYTYIAVRATTVSIVGCWRARVARMPVRSRRTRLGTGIGSGSGTRAQARTWLRAPGTVTVICIVGSMAACVCVCCCVVLYCMACNYAPMRRGSGAQLHRHRRFFNLRSTFTASSPQPRGRVEIITAPRIPDPSPLAILDPTWTSCSGDHWNADWHQFRMYMCRRKHVNGIP